MTDLDHRSARQRRVVEWAFRISLGGKAALGLFQVAAGIALWSAPAGVVPAAAAWLTRNELTEDPTDPLASRILSWSSTFNAQAEQFYILYFLGHGLLHFAVVASLLMKWRAAYPVSLGTLIVFVGYQSWRYTVSPDPALIFLTAIDIIVIIIVVLEHRLSRA